MTTLHVYDVQARRVDDNDAPPIVRRVVAPTKRDAIDQAWESLFDGLADDVELVARAFDVDEQP